MAARQRRGGRGAGHHRGLLTRSENLRTVPVDVALSSFILRHLVKKNKNKGKIHTNDMEWFKHPKRKTLTG